MKINYNYLDLKESYLFSKIAKKVKNYREAFPEQDIISLGIGDVTRALTPAVVTALNSAACEMGGADTFKGYGEEQGYAFLREAIASYYAEKSVILTPDEIFISDGAKSDLGNLLDIFAIDNTVLIPDPVYPVYMDTNIMAGRKIIFAKGGKENGFLPLPDNAVKTDIIYLCSPNNPTGAVYNKAQLKAWVDYALKFNAVILFDAAYEAFISDPSLPKSIYEIEGAKRCAIEICSLSKTAGFTGTRCGYTVLPNALISDGVALNKLWLRRQTTKFNGVSYIIQRGAAAVFSKQGRIESAENIRYYMDNAKIIGSALNTAGIWYTGGVNSPYIWMQCPNGLASWDFFDMLLEKINIVGTPGAGFGTAGEGYFRFTAFGDRENIVRASKKLVELLVK